MLVDKEYKHIVKCIKEMNLLEKGSKQWYDKFLWVRDRNRSSWMIGLITLEQYTKIDTYLNKLENAVKQKVLASSGKPLSR